jgi:hypothetical protein
MKNLTKILLLVVSAIVVVSTAGVLTPRVVKAVTATLVQNVDSPARNAYLASCYIASGYSNTSCAFTTPAGKEVVIQTVSFTGATNVSITTLDLTVVTTINGQPAYWTVEIPKSALDSAPYVPGAPLPTISSYYLSGSSTTLYADPTAAPGFNNITVNINADHQGFDRVAGWVTLAGYAVNLDSSSSASTL